MGLFSRAKPGDAPERRQSRRYRVDCKARLIMPSGDRTGRLFDLSEDGARVRTDNPPPKGCSAILEWGANEAYAHVIWANHDSCGLRFDKPLPRQIVEKSVGGDMETGTAAIGVVRGSFGQRRPVI